MTAARSTLRPPAIASDVAVARSSGGNARAGAFTLTPMPAITKRTRSTSASISVRMPATFRPSMRTSFGHLSCAGSPVSARIAAATAIPATSAELRHDRRLRHGTQHDRRVQVQASRRVPRPPETAPSSRLRLGDDARPLLRPVARQLARHPLRRVDLGVPHDPPPRAPEMRRQLGRARDDRASPRGRSPGRDARRSYSPARAARRSACARRRAYSRGGAPAPDPRPGRPQRAASRGSARWASRQRRQLQADVGRRRGVRERADRDVLARPSPRRREVVGT